MLVARAPFTRLAVNEESQEESQDEENDDTMNGATKMDENENAMGEKSTQRRRS